MAMILSPQQQAQVALQQQQQRQNRDAPATNQQPRQELDAQQVHQAMHGFTHVIGTLPFALPNIRTGFEVEDLSKVINPSDSANAKCLGVCCCAMTGVGLCYLCCKTKLIDEGAYGFSQNNGKYEILFAGWALLLSPCNSFEREYKQGEDLIQNGPVTIVRVCEGQLGFAMDGAQPQILLPGVHARKNAAFIFANSKDVNQDLIDYGPIKILIVRSGRVRICYSRGKAQILAEGRYAINDGTFAVGSLVDITQQNLRFAGHNVLLDGGISLLVEGLLTFQVVDVERLTNQLGETALVRAISDVTKAELSRVFAAVHLEQISTAQMETPMVPRASVSGEKSALGEFSEIAAGVPGDNEGESRSKICHQVIQHIAPIARAWGVKIINFQLESTKIADLTYAREYEVASLGIAKSKANLRSIEAENEIMIQRAAAKAQAIKIQAEGAGGALVIAAKSAASARKIEAEARNTAACSMKDSFARSLALANQQVDFAASLKASVLTVIPDSTMGSPIVSQIASAAPFQPRHK